MASAAIATATRPCGAPAPLELAAYEKAGPAQDPPSSDAGVSASSLPREPTPAGAERAIAGPGFAFLAGAAGLAELGCAPPAIARVALSRAVLAAEAELGVDAELAVVLSTHPLGCPNIYYLPLANDTRGIGYANVDAREVFDDTPNSLLDGVAFLNDWPYWQAHPGELESAFDHELGHRWGARVRARVLDATPTALLGRELSHWSYFLDTQGSPLEGNAWQAAASGYASATPTYPSLFSAFDLYAMGVLPAAEVPPATLLALPRTSDLDCHGTAPSAASPPQTCGSLELEAEPVRVSIEDVLAVEGPRRPPAEASASPRSVRVLALMLQSSNTPWRVQDCVEAGQAIRDRIDGFARAAADLLRLEDVLGDAASCDDLVRASAIASVIASRSDDAQSPPRAEPSGCAFEAPRAATLSARHRWPSGAPFASGLLCFGYARRRLQARRRHACRA